MPLKKRIVELPAFQNAVATAGAWYLRLVWYTSRRILDPADVYDTVEMPAILVMWHGQHFMMPFVKKNDPRHRSNLLISRHRDGEINTLRRWRGSFFLTNGIMKCWPCHITKIAGI